MADLTALTPPKDLDKAGRSVVFQYISRRLASHRNRAQLFAAADSRTSQENIQAYNIELNKWAQELQRAA